MNKNRNSRPRNLTLFERETERRRRDMLRDLSGRVANVPKSLLRVLPRSSRLLLLQKPERKAVRA